MNIRTRLALLFTVITAAIFGVFVAVIYLSAESSREHEFYARLKNEAITKANLFFKARVDARTLQDIYRNNRQILNEVEVAIFDTGFHLLYHDADDIDIVKENWQMMADVYRKGEIRFYQDDWQVIGLRYIYGDQVYMITAAAYDQYGYNKLNSLLKTSVIVFIVSILFIYVAGRFFSRRAFKPIRDMTGRANIISATNLDLRLQTGNSRDELARLADTFNEMLNRLENSFDAQRQFVSNISHELRTPLAAIITELELSANRERSVAEYREAIRSALSDARKLARLSNSLLDLAKASYDPAEISFRRVRVDEILLDARQQVQQGNTGYHIDIHFDSSPEQDEEISVNGNEYLLKVAFANLFENGCKFSDNRQSVVSISFDETGITLRFTDQGMGIPAEDLPHIFSPFYRGDNRKYADGNGIGLSLTRKIIDLHQGTISVQSEPGRGSVFMVRLPHV